MKYIILIIITFCYFNNHDTLLNNKSIQNIEEEFYNRLAIAARIENYTNRHIEAKANKRANIPSSLINQIQSEINYSTFKNDVISIMKSHYSLEQMQNAINNSSDLPYINITSPKIKKELNDAVIRFWNIVDLSLNTALTNNDF